MPYRLFKIKPYYDFEDRYCASQVAEFRRKHAQVGRISWLSVSVKAVLPLLAAASHLSDISILAERRRGVSLLRFPHCLSLCRRVTPFHNSRIGHWPHADPLFNALFHFRLRIIEKWSKFSKQIEGIKAPSRSSLINPVMTGSFVLSFPETHFIEVFLRLKTPRSPKLSIHNDFSSRFVGSLKAASYSETSFH